MDTSDPTIRFDAMGVCNHCREAEARLGKYPEADREQRLLELVETIKREGQGKEYDCIIGVSGGADSTAVAFHVKRLGLRPLAIHFDNGWNSELAVDNITRTLEALDIDLFTYVVDWEEFRDLQLSFLKASLANCEAPTDHGIDALLFRMAKKYGTRFILSGSNLATEAIMPISWGHYTQDLRLLKAVHKRFGKVPLRTMPLISIRDYIKCVFVDKIRQIPFLNYVDYDKEVAKEMFAREIGWRDYGGKHYESVWTRFFQGYYLPTKFGYDKRRAHLSSMIVSGQIQREDALAQMELPSYDANLLTQDLDFVIKKFGLESREFDELMKIPNRTASDYPNSLFVFHKLMWAKNIFRAIATES